MGADTSKLYFFPTAVYKLLCLLPVSLGSLDAAATGTQNAHKR